MNDSKFLSLNGLIYYDEKLKSRIKELYGSDMTVEWEEIKDGKNPFKLKIALKNGNGTELFSKTVDFPLEQTIVSGSYENSTKSLILYFQDGTSTKIPIKDLIEGLASKLDLDKKANLGVKTTDSNTAHIRDIPENALPYAGISKIGGMSYKSQNLIKQPYSFGSQTIQGVTITVNSDNSITFNGTATGDIALNMGQVYLRKDVSYTINGLNNLTEAQALFYVKTGGFFDKLLINSNGAVTKTCLKDGMATLELYIYRGTTIKQTVYPMFNEGSTSLPYEPYYEGLRDTKVTAIKSSLNKTKETVNIPYQKTTLGGVTITVKDDATITLNGTVTSEEYPNINDLLQRTFFLPYDSLPFSKYTRYGLSIKIISGTYTNANSALMALAYYSNQQKQKSIGWYGEDVFTDNDVSKINSIYLALRIGTVFKNLTYSFKILADDYVLTIPEAVQSLEGYGLGINSSLYNYFDFESKKFNRVVGKVDLSTLTWTLENDLYWISKSLTDIKYVLSNTEIGNALWGNGIVRMASGMSTSVSGELAIDTTRIACNNSSLSEKPTGLFVYELAIPTTEDISDLITSDNLIGVEGGGTVTLVNEYGYDVPCDIDFFTGDNKIVGSRVFVGDLMGKASFAKYFDVDGSPSEKTIAEALEDVTREDSPIKVTSTSIGQKATEGLELTVSTDVLANPPAEIGDIVIDAYTDTENLSYINLWEITGFDAGYSTMRIVGINSVNTGGGSASFSQKAEADGNGNNIAGTYATKQALKALEDSANDSIHNIEAAIDGVEANGQALAERLDTLGIVDGVVANSQDAVRASEATPGSGLDNTLNAAIKDASDALQNISDVKALANENKTQLEAIFNEDKPATVQKANMAYLYMDESGTNLGTIESIKSTTDALTARVDNAFEAIDDVTLTVNSKASQSEVTQLNTDVTELYSTSGTSIDVSWEPSVNGVNPYKLNIQLKNSAGDVLSTVQLDFPLEQMVVGAEYTESTKELVLETLEGTVKVPVSDIFRGLITESNIGNQTVAKASLATKATNDGQGNNIVQTYATNSNLNALENRVDNLDSDCQALADKFDSLGAVNGVVAKAVTATSAESAKAGSGLDNDITQARKDASDALARANSVLSLVNENKFQLEAIFNEDAPATVQKAKYAETAGSADYASRCRDSNGNPLLISNIVTKADAAELLASQANSASKSAIVSARCEYIKSSYQASVGTLNLYLKTADNREIAVTDFQEALMSLLEDFMS